MKHIYKETNINYYTQGNGDNLVVFLHGWGAGSELMTPLSTMLQNKCSDITAVLIDFPPFGDSQEPKEAFSMLDYKIIAHEIIENVRQNKSYNSITIVGHSFGGRVAILLEDEGFSNIILIASAGLKFRPLKIKLKIWFYKLLKKYKYKKLDNFGSDDYKNLSNVMKQTFKNIVNFDLSNHCKQFKSKCLIIAGSEDTETPLKTQKRLHKLIINSKLLVIKGGDHFAYLKNLNFVANQIKIFCNFH